MKYIKVESIIHGGDGSEGGSVGMAGAVSFSSYLGGRSSGRCPGYELSEGEPGPEMVYMSSRSLSEAVPWLSGVGVLLEIKNKIMRGHSENSDSPQVRGFSGCHASRSLGPISELFLL